MFMRSNHLEEEHQVQQADICASDHIDLLDRSLQSTTIETVCLEDNAMTPHIQPRKLDNHFKSQTLLSEHELTNYYGYIGDIDQDRVFLNTRNPFCALAIGVQGTGKSFSVSTMIENCLIDYKPYGNVPVPMATLVFHFDQDKGNMCEAVSMTQMSKHFKNIEAVKSTTILVSPTYFMSRAEYYKGIPNCTVLPLQFEWSSIGADQLMRLMRVNDIDDMPLYMSKTLTLLRGYQKRGSMPSYTRFKQDIQRLDLTPGQVGSLMQRLDIIDHFIGPGNLSGIFDKGQLVVCDLTDPLLPKDEVNGIFDIVLEKFIGSTRSNVGKMVVFDEAHKYFSEGADPLSQSVVRAVRQMRHHGLRVVLSTQSPKSIPGELIELSTLVLLHHFHVPSWYKFLKDKLPLGEEDFDKICHLKTGEALVYTKVWPKSMDPCAFKTMRIRNRMTKDAGQTKTML